MHTVAALLDIKLGILACPCCLLFILKAYPSAITFYSKVSKKVDIDPNHLLL